MKSSSNIGPCFSMHGYKRQYLSPKDFNTAKNPDPFITLLSDQLENIKNSGKLNSDTFALNKNILKQLIDAVQGQMNEYLFHELSSFDDDSDMPEFDYQWMELHMTKNFEAPSMSAIKHDRQKGKEIEAPHEIKDIIEHASKIYEVAPELIRSVIRAESDFDANATSSKGAMGLMQLMPETAKDLGVKNCYSPVENIMAGTRYLKSLLNRYDGNVELALAAYNWGMGNVERHPDKLPKETLTYIARIHGYLERGTS